MGKTAFLFTGQGSQVPGMGKDFYENCASSKNVFDLFDKVLNRDIRKISFYGSEEELKLTVNSQPCILSVELAIFEALKSQSEITIDYVAGHSLGEYAAMYAADVLSLEEVAKLIQARANAMSKINSGAMSAIIGLNGELLNEVLKEAASVGYVDIANYNTQEQTVITGETNAVKVASELALSKGAKRAIPLAVSGAFHSKIMIEASKEFEYSVNNAIINDAKIPVITNVDAQETILASDFKEKMPKQMYSSVRWLQTLIMLYEHGVDNFVEIGPSKILTGMVRKTLHDVKFSAICNLNDLEKFNNA